MRMPRLSNREQLLAALVFVVMVVFGYGLLRWLPWQKELGAMQSSIQATTARLAKTEIPEEPTETIAALTAQLNDQEQAMALIQRSAEHIEQRLASFDSQELRVRISQLAANSNVRIRVNQAFAGTAQQTAQAGGRNTAVADRSAPVLPESRSWIDRMSPGTLLQRPMQRLELEGNFEALQRFIYGLEELPWQVTVLRLRVEKLPTMSPAGYAQWLKAELVLAL